MPRLDDATAKKVDAAEDGFKPIPPGIYVVQLMEDVEVRESQTPNKPPYWKWTFEIPAGAEEFAGRRFWTNTSLSDAAHFKMKEMFGAFGVSTNTDTAELVGRKIRAEISVTTAQGGTRKGQLVNEFVKAYPLEGDLPEGAVSFAKTDAPAPGGDTTEPLF